MKFAQANIRSLNTSFNTLEVICSKNEFEVICLSEIWHPSTSITNNIKNKWHWISSERDNKGGGGVGIMISKKLKIIERKDLIRNDVEAVWCNIFNDESKILVGSVYVPPNNTESLKGFFKSLNSIIQQEKLPVIITGDFNAHHPEWQDGVENDLGKLLHEYLINKPISILNNSMPTRKNKIIDLTLSSSCLVDKISNWKVTEEVFLNTDHRLISFELGRRKEKDTWERLDFKAVDWQLWESECDLVFADWIEEHRQEKDVDILYESFCSSITNLKEKLIPKKTICAHSRGWWNKELGELTKKVKRAKRVFNKRSNETN